MATLEQVTQALLEAQQTMLAMRWQFDAEMRGMREEVENLRRAQPASASGPAPMDVSSLEGETLAFDRKGKGGKSKDGWHSVTLENRPICYRYITAGKSCSGQCGRAHCCHICFGKHPVYEHDVAAPAAAGR